MKKKSYQARLDIMAAALGAKGLAPDGFYCECSPYSGEPFDYPDFLQKVWVKMGGQKIDFTEFCQNITPRTCTLESQGKHCNPKPVEMCKVYKGEDLRALEEKVHRMLCEIMQIDYDDWLKTQEEKEERSPHIARDMYQEKQDREQIGVIDLVDPEPEPEPESSGDPLQDMIVKRLLNKSELADALLVPESAEDD